MCNMFVRTSLWLMNATAVIEQLSTFGNCLIARPSAERTFSVPSSPTEAILFSNTDKAVHAAGNELNLCKSVKVWVCTRASFCWMFTMKTGPVIQSKPLVIACVNKYIVRNILSGEVVDTARLLPSKNSKPVTSPFTGIFDTEIGMYSVSSSSSEYSSLVKRQRFTKFDDDHQLPVTKLFDSSNCSFMNRIFDTFCATNELYNCGDDIFALCFNDLYSFRAERIWSLRQMQLFDVSSWRTIILGYVSWCMAVCMCKSVRCVNTVSNV